MCYWRLVKRDETVFARGGDARAGKGLTQAEDAETSDLLRTLESLSSPTRIKLLSMLSAPRFVTDLADALQISRQATQKHLAALEEVGLVEARQGWRGAARAVEYVASPAGLFTFRETLHALTRPTTRRAFPLTPTRPSPADAPAAPAGAGLLLVHGDEPGRWFPLEGRSEWIIGRAEADDVCLAYDAFASARHAHLQREGSQWRVRDLRSRNGTRVNLRPLPSGGAMAIRRGDLLTVGRSHLLLQEESG